MTGMDVFVYARVSVCVITEGKQEERQKMNMLYGSSKILHGPSAREEPRAECLWLPNIINYLCAFTSSCCVWPAMSLRSRTGVGAACLFMNTNYTSVSLSLNASLLFQASPRLLVKTRTQRSDFMQWISTGTQSTQPYADWVCNCKKTQAPIIKYHKMSETGWPLWPSGRVTWPPGYAIG